jgi:predicted DNA-binding transcriptional regulator AlpA
MATKKRLGLLTTGKVLPPAADPPNDFTDRVLTEIETAALLGCSRDTLRRSFEDGRAPPRVRLSTRRIGYRLSEIYRFLNQHTEQPGSRVET